MVYFGSYLKDYLENSNMSQTEFASRMNVTQKHMSEIINGKTNITLEMAANIERLTGISVKFIIGVENYRKMKEEFLNYFKTLDKLEKYLKEEYFLKELKKRNWINLKNETDQVQNAIDLLDYLKAKDFNAVYNIENKVLFKKSGTDLKKLSLWIAHCDEIVNNQEVLEYKSSNFDILIEKLKELAYENTFDKEKVQRLLNKYGIFFADEKALSGTKVRGCFKVRGKHPAIYITQNYAAKDSFYFELFHELGHCKSDYNEAQNKVIVDGDEIIEKRADEFALNTMISYKLWSEIKDIIDEDKLIKFSKINKIPMCFIVGRLAKIGKIKYKDKLYNKYCVIHTAENK